MAIRAEPAVNRLYLPETADPVEARAAVDRDLKLVLALRGASSLEDLGWRRPSPLVLLIPLEAKRGEQTDQFLVELSFAYYPAWPPKVRFLNPETLELNTPSDLYWVPKISGCTAIATHESYGGGGNTFLGYVCCSFNLDFYLSEHSLANAYEHWNASPKNFNATLVMLELGLTKFYQGRFRDAS